MVSNPLEIEGWVRAEIDPFGADGEVFDFDETVWVKGQDGYYLNVPDRYGDEPSVMTKNLTIRENSSGGDVRLKVFFTDPGWSPDQGSLPWEFIVDELRFKVGQLTLEKANLFGLTSPTLTGYEKIYINIDANHQLEYPEFWKNHRFKKPEKAPYNQEVISPTAIIKGRPLNIAPTFSCMGIDSWKVSVECIPEDSEGTVICPYGDFEGVINCENSHQNNPFTSLLASDSSPDSVMV